MAQFRLNVCALGTQPLRKAARPNCGLGSMVMTTSAGSCICRLAGKSGLNAVFLILCLAFAVSVLPENAHAQRPPAGKIVANFGKWDITCRPPPPGSKSEICALVQSVAGEDSNNIGLTVYFQKYSNGTRMMRVFAPLGILLPNALRLKIDGKDIGSVPFLRCLIVGCYAQVVVEDKLAEQLKNGKTAMFEIYHTAEAGFAIPISLAGFSQGLAALK